VAAPGLGVEGLEVCPCTLCGAELDSRAVPALTFGDLLQAFFASIADAFARIFELLFGWMRA